jgi:UDP-N-acetylmuramoyl-L-alanyl-D-glutamate--2,6-diaminopimelate ligase
MRVKNLIKKFVPCFALDFYHFFLPMLGAFLYRFPSRKLIVLGVTGTNGKTTVVDLAVKILEEAGYKMASISSIEFKIKEKKYKNTLKMTMPGRMKLQRFLRRAKNVGCEYVVLEATSEGIKQHRHCFIDFDCAVFTNLSPEHIESHGSFEKYRQAKGELFRITKKVHIVNLDDENAKYFLQFPADKKIGFTMLENSGGLSSAILKVVRAQKCQVLPHGLKFFVDDVEFNLNLLGKFNIYNSLAAICIALSQGVDLEICKAALEKIKSVSGRMEVVIKKPFAVIVDYAHTPDALIKVYESIGNYKLQTTNPKQITNHKSRKFKLICVLGSAGGGRDKWKRFEFGKIAAQYCSQVILTNEDPYDENPLQILNEIEKGFSQTTICEKILDRRKAVRKALNSAKSGDIVIITGKGSEPWMCVEKGKKIPWDDRQVVREEFEKLDIDKDYQNR